MEAVAHSVSLFAGVRHFPMSRRRGAQPGNRNRLRHGGFSEAAQERRESVRALIRKLDRLIVIARAMHTADEARTIRDARSIASTHPPLEGGVEKI